jgi:formylmethanofuran dehydrogenase subunit D
MVDRDQTFEYSRIMAATTPCEIPPPTISPNPTSGLFKIAGVKSGDRVRVFNASGIEIINQPVQTDTDLQLDLTTRPKGIYTVSVLDSETDKLTVLKLAKL